MGAAERHAFSLGPRVRWTTSGLVRQPAPWSRRIRPSLGDVWLRLRRRQSVRRVLRLLQPGTKCSQCQDKLLALSRMPCKVRRRASRSRTGATWRLVALASVLATSALVGAAVPLLLVALVGDARWASGTLPCAGPPRREPRPPTPGSRAAQVERLAGGVEHLALRNVGGVWSASAYLCVTVLCERRGQF